MHTTSSLVACSENASSILTQKPKTCKVLKAAQIPAANAQSEKHVKEGAHMSETARCYTPAAGADHSAALAATKSTGNMQAVLGDAGAVWPG